MMLQQIDFDALPPAAVGRPLSYARWQDVARRNEVATVAVRRRNRATA